MKRWQDFKMAWWHGDMVTAKAKVTKKFPKIAKDCQKMVNIGSDKNGKICQNLSKAAKTWQK